MIDALDRGRTAAAQQQRDQSQRREPARCYFFNHVVHV